jgi:hypothetical protein
MRRALLTTGNLGGSPLERPKNLGAITRACLGGFRLLSFFAARFSTLAVVLGCGSTPATAALPAPAPRAEPGPSFDRNWGRRELRSVPIVVSLPDASGWHAKASGTFTLLEHGGTKSSLALRITLAPRLVRPEQCEADARLARPTLPGGDPSGIVERRKIGAPAGFDVRLVVGVEPRGGGVHGYALAVGAATSRCYVAAYDTEAAGEQAAERVAERLAVVVSGVLETMRVPNAEARVQPLPGVE